MSLQVSWLNQKFPTKLGLLKAPSFLVSTLANTLSSSKAYQGEGVWSRINSSWVVAVSWSGFKTSRGDFVHVFAHR